MEDLVERKCCFCSYKYYHEKNISYISLCPRCHKDGYFEPHYTKNGIKPCSIYLGAENIGKMTSDTEKNYRIVCDKFGIPEDFESEYTKIQVDMLGNYWLSK